MKIIAVGMNYRNHLPEISAPEPEEPVVFIKPDSALQKAPAYKCEKNKPFFLPYFSEQIEYETELVVRIDKLGKYISSKFAYKYYNEVTVGIDLTARDLQNKLRSAGNPWEISKGFDQSAIIGDFIKLSDAGNDIQDIDFSLNLNGEKVQNGCTSDMIFGVDKIIEYVSKFFTLKIGDLIFTGTPSGTGRLSVDDHLEASLGEKKLLDVRIK